LVFLSHLQRKSTKKHEHKTNLMADEEIKTAEPGTEGSDLDQNELAHSIIEALLDHTRVVSDLIALMAQALDQDTTRALTLTPQWQAYLESRRRMETTREEVERFVVALKENKPQMNADLHGLDSDRPDL